MRVSELKCDNCGQVIPIQEDRFELASIVWGPVSISPTRRPPMRSIVSDEKVARTKTCDYCSRGCVMDAASQMEERED